VWANPGGSVALGGAEQRLAASQYHQLLFGPGAATPLLVVGFLSREVWMRLRDRVLATGKVAKTAFGMLLIIIGMTVVSGIDRKLEAVLADASPQWLI
jgi:cytochrome c-type biogenesis protein